MGGFIDLTGLRFGKLTVMYRVSSQKCTMWHCICDCGNESNVQAGNLRGGKSKSCGCVTKERCLEVVTKHGKSNTRLHSIWAGMKDRCYNPNNKQFNNYGGRGITICEQWLDKENGFINFYDWAIKNGYSKELSIDRINVNGSYDSDNCRWATASQQMNNTRVNHRIEYKGKTQTLKQWSDELNLPYTLLLKRLRNGWTFEKAINEPEHFCNRKQINFHGKVWSIADLSKEYNIPYRLLHQRLNLLGWDVERAVTMPKRENHL